MVSNTRAGAEIHHFYLRSVIEERLHDGSALLRSSCSSFATAVIQILMFNAAWDGFLDVISV